MNCHKKRKKIRSKANRKDTDKGGGGGGGVLCEKGSFSSTAKNSLRWVLVFTMLSEESRTTKGIKSTHSWCNNDTFIK